MLSNQTQRTNNATKASNGKGIWSKLHCLIKKEGLLLCPHVKRSDEIRSSNGITDQSSMDKKKRGRPRRPCRCEVLEEKRYGRNPLGQKERVETTKIGQAWLKRSNYHDAMGAKSSCFRKNVSFIFLVFLQKKISQLQYDADLLKINRSAHDCLTF